MAEVRRRWGEAETVSEMVQKRRLEWLGQHHLWQPVVGHDARPQAAKGDAVQLVATTPTQM